MKTLKALLALVVLLVSCGTQAQSGSLDQWLRAEAAPALARLMDREPRFIGERVQIAALTSGRVGIIDNALAADIRDTLRHQLMNRSRISFPLGAGDACSNDIQIVLGIEVSQTGRYEHRIQLALLDLGDDLWINDSSHIWEGRLSRAQLRGLTTPISVARTTTTPASHVPERAPVKSDHCLQQPAAEVELALLSPLLIDDRKVECRGEGRHCVELTYETYGDAFVFEFFTRSGELYALDCDEPRKPHYGDRRKGLRVPASGHVDRPSLGFYVVATQNRDVARQIRQALHESSSSCEGFADAEARTRLTRLVASPAVDWQAILLRQEQGHVSRMEVST